VVPVVPVVAVVLPVDADVEPVVVVSGVVVVIVVTVVVEPVVIVLVIVVVAWMLDGAAPASSTAAVNPSPMSAAKATAHFTRRMYERFTGIPPFRADAYPDCRVLTPSSADSPRSVRATFPPRIWTSPSETASSQMERRGQLVPHASIASRYIRGVLAIHARRSRVSGLTVIHTE